MMAFAWFVVALVLALFGAGLLVVFCGWAADLRDIAEDRRP